MRRYLYSLAGMFLLIFSFRGFAQPSESGVQPAFSDTEQHTRHAILREFHAFRQAIEGERLYWEAQASKRPVNKNLLYKLFRHTKKNLLKEYQAYSRWSDLPENGAFDCVTGSMVYAYLLGKIGVPYEIMEAPHHVFVKVHLGNEEIVLESTDENGFLEFEQDIAEHARFYAEGGQFTGISFVQLIALYYYNQAAHAFNRGQWEVARRYIHEADLLYSSARIRELKAELESRAQWMVAQFSF
ncbi:MAG: hypothetical protein KatS3mg033_1609 [Thermonema sp.]|uniref:hypothetical protein n=1 Tax=Thermonema sp. TaxID=2231181 RepID=UPI0021DD7E6B|nr:hypothetical protein [Thermonema sp.]GIV39809.1 MAG: hypothetical protein KatS3mg033_1609 [Thermonema sp.]